MESESSENSNCGSDGSVQETENSNGSDGPVQETDAETKATLQAELKSWSASSAKELKTAETEQECKFSTPPDWKCIICKNSITNYVVYQCQTGHLACKSCSKSGKNCPKCSKAVSRIRNLAVEDMMKSLVVNCKFANLGCKEVINYKNMKAQSDHEENCCFAPMVCPMPICSQAGVKFLLSQHLLSMHGISFMVDVVENERYYCSGYPFGYTGNSEEFELDSSMTSVMVRHMESKEIHLLRQESTTFEDRLQIKSLVDSRRRKYELDVTNNKEKTYCLKSESTYNIEQGVQLVIPKQPGDDTLKKRCKIYM